MVAIVIHRNCSCALENNSVACIDERLSCTGSLEKEWKRAKSSKLNRMYVSYGIVLLHVLQTMNNVPITLIQCTLF